MFLFFIIEKIKREGNSRIPKNTHRIHQIAVAALQHCAIGINPPELFLAFPTSPKQGGHTGPEAWVVVVVDAVGEIVGEGSGVG